MNLGHSDWPNWLTILAAFVACAILGYWQSIRKLKDKIVVLESKVAFLYQNGSIVYDPLPGLPPAIHEALVAGHKIKAIKLYRQVTHKGLREAKEDVDNMMP